jgi:hypothetical protein
MFQQFQTALVSDFGAPSSQFAVVLQQLVAVPLRDRLRVANRFYNALDLTDGVVTHRIGCSPGQHVNFRFKSGPTHCCCEQLRKQPQSNEDLKQGVERSETTAVQIPSHASCREQRLLAVASIAV